MQAGEHRRELVLVLSGSCRLYYPRSVGEERTTYFFFENRLLADYSGCLTGQPSQFGIQALTDTEPVAFDYAVLRRLYDERPVYERFGRLVAEYRPLDPSAAALARGALPVSLLASGKTKILERIPQHLLANYLGVTPVSLGRIRGRVARTRMRPS